MKLTIEERNKLIDRAIHDTVELYMQEDYDYTRDYFKINKKLPPGTTYSVDDQVKFIIRNDLAHPELSIADIRKAAKVILYKLKEIEDSIKRGIK